MQKELNILKHLLRLAVEWEIIPINPSQGVKSPRVPAGRVRYLQHTGMRSAPEECPEWLRPIVALAFCFHDLRHTAASWLRMSGADIQTVAQLLGHKDLRMAARYQHLNPGFLAEAVGRLDGVYGELRYPGLSKEKALTDDTPVSA